MKRIASSFATTASVIVSVAALLVAPFTVVTAAHAQQEGGPDIAAYQFSFRGGSPAAQETAQNALQDEQTSATGSRKARAEKKTALKRVLIAMQNKEAEARAAGVPGSDGDGITLVASSSVADLGVTPVTETTTASTVETQLDKIVKELPRGSRWVKLMLPPTPKNKTLHGDDVADYALAQARMYGSVGEAALPKDGIEVISQPLTGDKAKAVVPALNLRPVYLILNPDTHVAMRRGSQSENTAVYGRFPLRGALFTTSGQEAARQYEILTGAVSELNRIRTNPAPVSTP